MTTPPPDTSRPGLAYDLLLGVSGGGAIGFFVWVAIGMTGVEVAVWPLALAGMVGGVLLVRRNTRSPRRRWIHLLWIAYALFGLFFLYLAFLLKNMT